MQIQYPYKNMSLKDMQGELWKPLPGFEVYCMVSNMGRVKALPRILVYRDGCKGVYLKERILRQSVVKGNKNKLTGNIHKQLYIYLKVDNMQIRKSVARTVYHLFIDELPDFKEERIYISHKDDDTLNNRADNLFKNTHHDISQRNYKTGKAKPPVYKNLSNEAQQKIKLRAAKTVSQFDMEGNYLATYESLSEASRSVGASIESIKCVIRGQSSHAKGFLWKWGDDKSPLPEEVVKRYRELKNSLTRQIEQFSAEGEYINTYRSMSHAARCVGCSEALVLLAVKKKIKYAKGFIFRYKE